LINALILLLHFQILGKNGNDLVQCFCCNRGLINWQSKDDPWTEHAFWSPTCKYLLLMKGKQFVEEVHDKFGCIKNKEKMVCICLKVNYNNV